MDATPDEIEAAEALVELIAEDAAAWLSCGRPTGHRDPVVRAYRQSMAALVTLREAMAQDARLPSLIAMAALAEDERGGAMRVLGRCRAALRRVIGDHESGDARLSPGTEAMVKLALE